jgi:hypothetical protein
MCSGVEEVRIFCQSLDSEDQVHKLKMFFEKLEKKEDLKSAA